MPSKCKYLSFNVIEYIKLERLTKLNRMAYKKITYFISIVFIQNYI